MMGEQAAETKKTETSLPEGKIVQVSGPVVDVKFGRAHSRKSGKDVCDGSCQAHGK